jgi:hypothetical protein
VVIILGRDMDRWEPQGVVRLALQEQRIMHIGDYLHCPWILSAPGSIVLADPS